MTFTCMRLSVMLTLHSISLWSIDTEISLEGDKNFTPVTFVSYQNHKHYIHVQCTFNLYWCLPQLLLSFHCLTFFSSTSISIFTIVKTFYNILYTFIFCFFLCIKFSFSCLNIFCISCVYIQHSLFTCTCNFCWMST